MARSIPRSSGLWTHAADQRCGGGICMPGGMTETVIYSLHDERCSAIVVERRNTYHRGHKRFSMNMETREFLGSRSLSNLNDGSLQQLGRKRISIARLHTVSA